MRNNHIPETLLFICSALQRAGGQAWLVGGCVRDFQLGLQPKDWDIEVYQLLPKALESILQQLGRCTFVGKQFGVYKLWRGGLSVDVALPRRERKAGAGHQGFDVKPDPYMKPKQAVLRRDFTINAMMLDPLSNTLLDFHHGLMDLNAKCLRHVSPAFVEDPLRPLRAMQFAARFSMVLAPETASLCHDLRKEYTTLPASRIWQEWLKWAESDTPSYGLVALKDMAWLSLYPELHALQGCPQDAHWHPEGDVWMHTCLVVDAAAQIKKKRALSDQQQLYLIFAALCHDLGKPETTFQDDQGNIRSPKHAHASQSATTSFLQRIAAPKSMRRYVLPLVQEHMVHGKVKSASVFQLSYRLTPASIKLWEALTQADASGRAPLPASRPALAWLQKADMFMVQHKPPKPMITGRLLMTWGYQPSPAMGKILQQTYQAQLDGFFDSEASGKRWVAKNLLLSVR